MRVLHAIHDFLPRHRAGSEVYAHALAHAQIGRHEVTVVCAEYDPAQPHGHVIWRIHDGVPVVEIVNNWRAASFAETYAPPLIEARLTHVLDLLRPDVVHVHNLLNLSFGLPRLAKARGAAVVATLHDYTLVCAAGGQRVHEREAHLCRDIEADRCARCVGESAYGARVALARTAAAVPGTEWLGRAAAVIRRNAPRTAVRLGRVAGRVAGSSITAVDIGARLDAARAVFGDIDLFVAPSQSMAGEYRRLGVPDERLVVSDYGFTPIERPAGRAPGRSGPLRLGFAGTLVWHKGVHVLIEALRRLPAGRAMLDVFGDTGTFPDYAADLRRRAEGLPVTFLGAFDRAGLAGAYGAIDALVVPSLWLENSPLVIHEAFQMGVPVVGARIGGIPDLISHEVNGLLVEPGSAESLAAALMRLIAEPGLLATLVAGAPPVKSIAADAGEWDARYRALADEEMPA